MPGERPTSPSWILPTLIGSAVSVALTLVAVWIYLAARPSEPGASDQLPPAETATMPLPKQPSPRPNGEEWGSLKPMAEALGPGSLFQSFLRRLQEAEESSPPILAITTPELSPEVCFNYTVTGDGKIFQELHVGSCLNELYLYILFAADKSSDIHRATANRNAGVLRVAQAAGLTPTEVHRLQAVMARLPLARGLALENAMWQFISALPQRVQRNYKAAWPYHRQPDIQANVMTDGVGPAVGFPLSQAIVLDVGFCPLVPLERSDPQCEYGKFGAWWTAAIHPISDGSYTQTKATELAGNTTLLPWPRLTLVEVDQFIQSPNRKDVN